METTSAPDFSAGEKASKKAPLLVRVHPRYVRLRQGSEIRYHLKLTRPPSRGKGVTIHVCVVNNKCGISVEPAQLVITASDWRLPREVAILCELEADIRTIQIYHKIHENYDEVFSSATIVPSVFVSVLQKEATFLFAFGCGLHGRLGTSEEVNANVPTPFACKWLHPVQITCGKSHSAIIDVYSNIYCFGNNSNGQLGQGDHNLEPSKLPLRVPSIGTSAILQVSCGSNHTMCMTIDGKVFTWGDNAFGQLGIGATSTKPRGTPTRVEKVVNVRALFCGGNQSFLVTLDNNVLAAGSNIAGQLGVGDRTDRATFERLSFFRKLYSNLSSSSREQLTQAAAVAAMPFGDVELACGLYHTMALCGKRVYSWGNGDEGRLGHRNLESCLEPMAIDALSDVPIKQIACGGRHSGAISTAGDVFTWGNGQYGQLGHGVARSRRAPTRVRLLVNKHVSQLSFGEWHSMALCEDGTLYAWGFGEEGQLGLPEDSKQKATRVVPLPTIVTAMSGTGATNVRCGGAHTFVVTVLESRRPQLAQLHRKASRLEIHKEVTRIATIERQRSRRHASESPTRGRQELAHGHGHDLRATLPIQLQEPGHFVTLKHIHRPHETKTKATTRRFKTPTDDDEDEVEDEDERLAFSWKDRPLSSRTSVRNALRQEMRVVSEMKTLLTPRSAPPTSSSSARRAQSANSAAFVSPRLRRLHEQVVRASDAGMALARTQSLVSDGATATQIHDAVDQATRSLLHPQRVGISTRHVASRHELVVVCESPRDDDDDEEEEEEEAITVGGYDIAAIEAAIRRTQAGANKGRRARYVMEEDDNEDA